MDALNLSLLARALMRMEGSGMHMVIISCIREASRKLQHLSGDQLAEIAARVVRVCARACMRWRTLPHAAIRCHIG